MRAHDARAVARARERSIFGDVREVIDRPALVVDRGLEREMDGHSGANAKRRALKTPIVAIARRASFSPRIAFDATTESARRVLRRSSTATARRRRVTREGRARVRNLNVTERAFRERALESPRARPSTSRHDARAR